MSGGSLKKGFSARERNVQASQKCTFLLLAGAKAPDPDAACGREVFDSGDTGRCGMTEKYEICLHLNEKEKNGWSVMRNGSDRTPICETHCWEYSESYSDYRIFALTKIEVAF